MNLARITRRHLQSAWIRSASTMLAVSLCVFLICTLQTVLQAVQWGLRSGGSTRLITRAAMGLTSSIPTTYKARIAAVPGVTGIAAVTFFMGFRGATPDWGSYFPNYAIDDDYLGLHPEFVVPPDQLKAWAGNRRGCIIGPALVRKMGWKIGDRFQLESIIPPYKSGRGPFEFIVEAIYSVDPRSPGTDQSTMFFHFKYLEDGVGKTVNTKTFSIAIAAAEQAAPIGQAIDALFESSERPTRTETEAAFQAGFLSMAGNLATLLNGLGLIISLTVLLIVANTMSMSIRERRGEVAVLKTLGFRSGTVMRLILGESIGISLAGGAIGIGLSALIVRLMPQLPIVGGVFTQAPDFGLSTIVVVIGFVVALLVGLLAGLVPAISAYRARISESLRAI